LEVFYPYSIGRPTKDPIMLMKILLIQYLKGFRSVRFTCKQVKQHAMYRWFLGISPTEKNSRSLNNFKVSFATSTGCGVLEEFF